MRSVEIKKLTAVFFLPSQTCDKCKHKRKSTKKFSIQRFPSILVLRILKNVDICYFLIYFLFPFTSTYKVVLINICDKADDGIKVIFHASSGLRVRFFKKIQDWILNPKESENVFCVSLLNRSIQDLSNHGSSKEPKNHPLPEWVLRFL